MNEKNQKTIIYLLGIALYITLIGAIIMVLAGVALEVIVVFTGIATAIVTALVTFLQGKNMSEKQDETLEKYYLNKAINNDDKLVLGSIAFDTEEEMDEYLKNHTVEDMINEADTVELDGEGDVQ